MAPATEDEPALVAAALDAGIDAGMIPARHEPVDEPLTEALAGRAPVVRARTPALEETQNILVVGVDRRPGARRGGRPDTLLVAVLDERSSHVGLVSVPRDLYVDIEGHGPARINTAFSVARRLGEDPMALLRRVVEDTLSLPIRHTILVDLGGFEALVDAVGGVEVAVPCPIRDRFIDPRAPSGHRMLDLEAGAHHLDGTTAGMYVRSRHGRSDFSRTRRQQAVVLGLRHRLAEPSTLLRLPALLDATEAMVRTDLSRLELLRLARRASRVDPSHLHGLVFGARETAPHRTPEGRAVLLPRKDAIDDALAHLFEAPPPGERPSARACKPADVALTREARATR
jgi:LCP family protein required for cell wall assembly